MVRPSGGAKYNCSPAGKCNIFAIGQHLCLFFSRCCRSRSLSQIYRNLDILSSPQRRRDSSSLEEDFLLRWRLASTVWIRICSYIASTGMTFRKPCGSSQSGSHQETWFSFPGNGKRKGTWCNTRAFLPGETIYARTQRNTLPLSMYDGTSVSEILINVKPMGLASG